MMLRHLLLIAALVVPPLAAIADNAAPVPARRLVLTQDQDLRGTDLQSIFDTTYDACAAACLANDRCMALTFNTRANSCFLKSATSGEEPYRGALSGWVRTAAKGAAELAARRAGELGFLPSSDVDAALAQAETLAAEHITGDARADDLLAAAAEARGRQDALTASRFVGAALNLTDAADQWLDYAGLLLAIKTDDAGLKQTYNQKSLSATVNAYLRADTRGLRASALYVMAQALETNGRGHDMIPALKLAQTVQARDDAAALLDDAIGKYGFRVVEHSVENEGVTPRICATFNSDLMATGVDYATYVQLSQSTLSVEASGAKICVAGVDFGKRYGLTFRAGLPAADGETLAKDTDLQIYVTDRPAEVSFPGRAYILPRSADNGIPVQTVNAQKLALKLQRVSDRNLVQTMQQNYFASPLDRYSTDSFNYQFAEQVWSGSADLAKGEPNRDITTRLPLDGVMKTLGTGIYALQAEIPEANPDTTLPATQWFVISDLGLTTMVGTDGLHVVVRALSDAGARAGVKVSLISRGNSVIAALTTDDQGYVHFPAAMIAGHGNSAPALVTAELGDDYSFLSLTDPEFDLSDRGVTGRDAAPAVDVFLSTDRGAYRAGEVVNATILARDATMKALAGLPLRARLIRPDGVEYRRVIAADAGAGGRSVSVPIDGGAPRGTWRIEVFAEDEGPTLASQPFLVEDFLPERIDFALSLPDGPLHMGESPEIGVAARYLFGAPGADLAIEGDYAISQVATLADFPGYQFGSYTDGFAGASDSIADAGTTDDKGNATVTLALPDLGPTANRPLNAHIALRLAEASGRPVERSIDRTLLPDTPVIGIKPKFAGGVAAENSAAGFDLIAVGPDGKAAGRAVKWAVNRLDYRYQWYSLNGSWNWEATTSRTKIADGTADLAAAGPVTVTAPVKWGDYEIVVASADGAYTTSAMRFYAGGYAPADTSVTPDMLELSLDKPAYRPGDVAHLRIVPKAAGVALVSVMSNHLIAMKAVDVKAGENLIDLPVTDDWGAGAYVTAAALRPTADAGSHAPARALGLSYAPVEPGPRKLHATVEIAAETAPRGPLPVAVKVDGVAPGNTAWVTVAAVDVGILNLTNFAAPDPEGHYLGQQKLGMAIRDIYGRLIDSRNGAPGVVRSGGDAGAVPLKAPPPTEELVAYFAGPVQVGADGYARTDFKLPSFNGTVRVMAVAWSETGVGEAQAETLVRDPVVVTASVPRFLGPRDQSTLRLQLVHATGPSGRMGLDVTADGLTLGAVPSGVNLADHGKVTLTIPLGAGPADGTGHVRVALTTPDGRQLTKTLTIPVSTNDPAIARQSQFTLAPGKAFTLDANVFDGLTPGSGHATLALGPISRFNAPGILAALDRYPYGCTEQITSKALPLIYFEDVAAAMGAGDTSGIHARVQEAIGAVLLNQSSNGAFGLWRPDTGDLWLDAYVTDFLSRAKAAGYEVPDTAFRNALDNLRNQINYAPDFDSDQTGIAYALMVLAREGAAAIGDLRYYADVKAEAFDTPMSAAELGAALAAYGDQTRADQMFRHAGEVLARRTANTTPEAQIWRADYGTDLRDAAALLALASEAGSNAVSTDKLGQSVARYLLNRSLSTQEASWALLATHALIGGGGSDKFTVNGAPLTGPFVRVLDAQTTGGGAEVIANAGATDATLTLTTFGVPSTPEPAGGKGYKITRAWFTLDGAEVQLDTVKQGTRLVAVDEITPLGSGEARLMVNDPLPAGFEIDNPNLISSGSIAALDWLDATTDTRNVEFRQDRFLAAVDQTGKDTFRLAYIVRAISPGTYHLPAASVEDMYRPDYRAHTESGTVTITE